MALNAGRYAGLASSWVRSAVGARRRRTELRAVEGFFLFVGYRRSGHSLLGALLDAHPEIVAAHGLNVLRHVRYGFRRDAILHLILENAERHAARGREVTGYSYAVPGQWQGRWQRLRVMGSTRGGATARALFADPALARRVQDTLGLPVRYLHVVRNPFDNIATLALRGRSRRDLDSAIDDYFHMADGVSRLRAAVGAEAIRDVRHEALVADPRATLRDLAGWLGVSAPEDWLAACAGIVFERPHRTRDDAPWTPEQRARVTARMSEHPHLAGYDFEN